MRSFLICSTVRITKSRTSTWHDKKKGMVHTIFVAKCHIRCLGRHTTRWEGNITMGVIEI
jgi:hypothetical protein